MTPTTTTSPDPAEVERLLALSDERDQWLKRLHAVAREAFKRGRAFGDDEGYVRAERDMDRRWNEVARPIARSGHDHAELELKRWGPGGREHFGDPRPGDLGPGEAQRKARASWEPLGLAPPGMVHLGGRAVHHHACTSACDYEPGWHKPLAAAAILATLPGDYAKTITALRTTPASGRRAA